MGQDDTAELNDEKQAQADFDAGIAMETPPPKAAASKPDKPDQKQPTPKPEAAPEPQPPEYVQITRDQFAAFEAAAAKTASHEQQLSKAFGTIGNVQRLVNALQAQTPRGLKVEMPKDAFAGMAKDFPEFAEQIRAGVEASLKGISGTGAPAAEIDPEHMQQLVSENVVRLQMEALEDDHPDWRKIVGAVDITKEQPDPNNAFRKWLSTKDAAYQARINGSNSAAVLSRAITRFQTETKPAPVTPTPRQSPRAQAQAERIQGAVQPRGDGAHAGGSRATDNDEFEAGFASR